MRTTPLRKTALAARSAVDSVEDPLQLIGALRSGRAPRILVVGDLVADRYIFGRTDRISREAPVLIVRHERDEVRLGGAANAAWNAAALGAEVTLLGVLGEDEMGRQVRELCRQSGIRVQAVTAPGLRTETKTRILAGGVNTSRQQMLRLDEGQEGELSSALRAQLASELRRLARICDALLVSDYGAGVMGPECVELTGELASRVPVAVDSRFNLAAFKSATVVKPNEPELAHATGMPIETAAEVGRAARVLQKRLGCQAVLVTRGREGMAITTSKGAALQHIPPHGSPDAVDVTGAGDTVIAAFTAGIAVGGGFLAAARLANVAGGLVVAKPGTASVTLDELQGALQSHG